MSVAGNPAKLKAVRFLFWSHFYSAVLVPFYTDWGGLTLSWVFLINAWFMLWTFVLEVPTGAVADHWGRKASLVLGCFVGIAGAWLYTYKPSLACFLAAEVVLAAAYALHSGADEALAYDSLKDLGREKEAKTLLTRMESFKLAGILIAAAVGGFIAESWGLTAPMRCWAGALVLAAVVCLTLKEPRAGRQETQRSYFALISEGWKFFKGHKVLLILSIELAFANALAWSIIWLYQPFLRKAGLPLASFGLVHAGAGLVQILLLARVEAFERLCGSKSGALTAGVVLAGLSFVGLAFATTPFWTIAAVLGAFAFGLTRAPVFSAYMNRYIPSEKRATVLSMSSMLRTFGIVIVNPLIGWGADRSLTWTSGLIGAGLLLLAFLSRIEESHLPD